MSPQTDPSPNPEPTTAPEPPRVRIRWHDAHQVLCPACNSFFVFTDSQSMVVEAKAAGIPEPVTFVRPIEAMFQNERTKIFPVSCAHCQRPYIAFIDVVNRVQLAERRQNLMDLKLYNPRAFASQYEGETDEDVMQRLAPEKRRMVLVSKEEFARRVVLERNHMVRDSLIRKLEERGLWTAPARGQLAAGFIADTVVGP